MYLLREAAHDAGQTSNNASKSVGKKRNAAKELKAQEVAETSITSVNLGRYELPHHRELTLLDNFDWTNNFYLRDCKQVCTNI